MQTGTQVAESAAAPRTTSTDEPAVPDRTAARSLVGGGSLLALATLAANAANYGLNLLLGRWLSAAEFADANLLVTLMLLVAAVAAPLQMVTVRAVATQDARHRALEGEQAAAWLYRRAGIVGVGLGLVFALPAPAWHHLFHTESPWPFVLLAVAVPAYLRQAVRRGVLQGRLQFSRLAVTYLVEATARLTLAAAFVLAGWGAVGATAGLALSFWVTSGAVRWMQPLPAQGSLDLGGRGDLRRFVGPTALLLAGQLVINNADVLVVKATFPGAMAGVYGAVALIGRAVFFVSWSTVATLFPAITRREARAEGAHRLLLGGVTVISVLCGAMVAAAAGWGEAFLVATMGPEFAGTQSLLVRYALATMIFAVTNLLVTYQLSLGRTREIRVLLGLALAQAAMVTLYRGSLAQVVDVQVVVMSALLFSVVGSMMLAARTRARAGTAPAGAGGVR